MLVETGLGGNVVTDATLTDLANRWMAMAEPTLSPTTYPEYRRLLDRLILPRLGPVKLRALRTAQIDSFYSEIRARGGKEGRPLSATSVQHVHALLQRILNQGVRWGWLSVNPAQHASPPRVIKTGINPPSPEQIQRLLIFASEHDPELTTYLRLTAVTRRPAGGAMRAALA